MKKSIYFLSRRESGFTLAEAMIALVVIGIVAAFTVPTLMHNYSQRVNSERHANIVYKMATAMHNMKNNGELNGNFNTTMDFVNRLKKYIKIDKICDSEHIADCWGKKTVITRSGAKYDVSNAKTRADILYGANKGDTPNVGIILADGANLILTYNPDYEGLEPGEKTEYTPAKLPVGQGLEEFKEYSNNTMGGLAFIFDVNGNGGPNKQQAKKVGNEHRDVFDIRGFHGARFDAKNVENSTCADFVDYKHYEATDGTCYFRAPETMDWASAMSYECPGGATNLSAMMKQSNLNNICNTIRTATNNANPLVHLNVWSSQEYNSRYACYVLFQADSCHNYYANNTADYSVLCAR